MITGDKTETAVNIAVSCHLVSDPEAIMMLCVHEKEEGCVFAACSSSCGRALCACDCCSRELWSHASWPFAGAADKAHKLLDQYLERLRDSFEEETGQKVSNAQEIPDNWQKEELCVDGPTLSHLLGGATS